MKKILKERLQKLAGVQINEQTTPNKDIAGECANKTLLSLPDNTATSLASYWESWALNASIPWFTVEGATAALMGEVLLSELEGGNSFLDYYFDLFPYATDPMPEPICPYAFAYTVDVPVFNLGSDISGTPVTDPNFDFGDPMAVFTIQSTQDFITQFNTNFYSILLQPLGISIPSTMYQLQNAIAQYNAFQDGGLFIGNVESIQFGLCECEWEYEGCTDETAENFDSEATVDDGSCEYCNNLVGNTCCDFMDEIFELVGPGSLESVCAPQCTTYDGWTPNPYSQEDFSDLTNQPGYEDVAVCCSNYGYSDPNEGESNCNLKCVHPEAENYDAEFANLIGFTDVMSGNPAELNPLAGVQPLGLYQNFGPPGVCEFIFGCADPNAFNYNPDATLGTVNMNENVPVLNFSPGMSISLVGLEYQGYGCIPVIEGCTDETALNPNWDANTDDGTCVYVEGCTDPDAFNFNPESDSDDGSCAYNPGCNDPEAANYDEAVDIDNGSCYYNPGCTDNTMFNYDANADADDDSCIPVVYGCLDPNGLNYGQNYTNIIVTNDFGDTAVLNDLEPVDDPANTPINVSDVPAQEGFPAYPAIQALYFGFWDENTGCIMPNPGCMDSEACNYDNAANIDEGCEYESCAGCTDPGACNYMGPVLSSPSQPNNQIDDGSCEYESCVGCIDPTACNANPDAAIYINDPEQCDFTSCVGCADAELGCNYGGEGTIPYIGWDGNLDEIFMNCTDDCWGCMDENAQNYDPNATIQPPSDVVGPDFCVYDSRPDEEEPDKLDPGKDVRPGPGKPDKPGVSWIKPDPDPVSGLGDRPPYDKPLDDKPGKSPYGKDKPEPGDQDLIPFERPGCIDESACNYDDSANTDDGSCVYPGDECENPQDPNGTVIPYITGVYNSNCVCSIGNLLNCDIPENYMCDPDCDGFSCQDCFDNYVDNSQNPDYGGGMVFTGQYNWPSAQCLEMNSGPWYDSVNEILSESVVKRFKKLANIKKKK